jgi:uncharacterized protein (TIGR01777 family)
MKFLISGATGLVGTRLVRHLADRGHTVNFLTMRRELEMFGDAAQGFMWNPSLKAFDMRSLSGVGTIIHLAGAPISKPWTNDYKKQILSSRVDSARLLLEAVKTHGHTVTHFISASAIGIYKNSLTLVHDESSIAYADGFLADVVKQWEHAADAFGELGISVTKVRTGLVLSADGGALPQLAKPIKWGLGSPLGSGRQMQSWIQIDDLVRIYTFVAENQLSGVYNAVAPKAVSNRELVEQLARRLKRPLWLPAVPEFALKIALGERYRLLVESQHVMPTKILQAGYPFKFETLPSALAEIYP